MAVKVTPYRRFLLSAFHSRFGQASLLALLVNWDNAVWVGPKSSCECRNYRRAPRLTLSSDLVVVSTGAGGPASPLLLHFESGNLCSACGHARYRRPNQSHTIYCFPWLPAEFFDVQNLRLIPFLGMVVWRGIRLFLSGWSESCLGQEGRYEHIR